MKRKPFTAQRLLEGLALNYVDRGGKRLFQVRSEILSDPLSTQDYRLNLSDEELEEHLNVQEKTLLLKRVVNAVRLVEDTADEDLQILVDQKFGKGDGM